MHHIRWNKNGLTNTKALGIENSTGTLAAFPTGRNSGTWTATNEGWRFAPIVPPTYSYAWLPTTGLSNPAIANPIATPPAGTTTYSVTVTNNSTGCVNTATTVLTNLGAGDAAPVGTGAGRCGTGIVNLTATGTSTLNWYNQATGGSIQGTGSTFTTPSISATTSYYVESFNGNCPSPRTTVTATVTAIPTTSPTASPVAICSGGTSQLNAGTFLNGTLTTGLLAGNGSSGNAFNVTATQTITLHNFSMTSTTASTAQVWYIPGGFAGPTLSSSTGWTLAGSGSIAIATNAPIVGLDANITIPAGQTYGIVVVSNGSNSYTNGTTFGNTWATDGILTIKEGCGGTGYGGTFSFTNSPRNFNGAISYSYGDPNLTFNWSPSATLNSANIINPVASPTTTTTYTVQVTNLAGCQNSNTTTVSVPATPAGPVASVNSVPCGFGIANVSTTGSGGTIKWYNAATGGTLLFTGSPYNINVNGNTTIYVSETTLAAPFCESSRTPVSIVVGTTDPISASADITLICGAAPGATLVTLTGANIASIPTNTYDYTWTASTGGALNATTGTLVTANPTQSATYTLTAFDAGTNCTAVQTVFVGLGTTPVINSVTASPASVCLGDVSVLTVTNPPVTGPQTLPIGYGASNATTPAADEEIHGVSLGVGGSILNQTSTCSTTGGGAANCLPA